MTLHKLGVKKKRSKGEELLLYMENRIGRWLKRCSFWFFDDALNKVTKAANTPAYN